MDRAPANRDVRAPLLPEPRLLPILGVVFIVMMGMGMMIPVLPLFAARFGGGSATVGLMLASFGTARLLASVPAGFASERFGRRPTMTAGILLLSVSSFAAAFSLSPSALMACLFFQGLGSALYVTSAMAAVADRATPASRGRLMSSYQAALLLGVSVGPAIGGAVTDVMDIGTEEIGHVEMLATMIARLGDLARGGSGASLWSDSA